MSLFTLLQILLSPSSIHQPDSVMHDNALLTDFADMRKEPIFCVNWR